jgi:preprotein translocase subunit SecF
MELFRNTNFDFLKYKWPFIIASLAITVAGLISLGIKGGPRWGIDFQGGTLMTYKFSGPPPVAEIRAVLDKALPSAPTVQNFTGGENQVSIGTAGEDNTALTKNRQLVLDTFEKTFAKPEAGKLDFNNSSRETVREQLRDPLVKNGVLLSDPQLDKLVADMLSFRNTPPRSGVITDLGQLAAVPGVTPAVVKALHDTFYLAPFNLQSTDFVGPKVGKDLRTYAVRATLLALAGMLAYIAFRFEWIYGLAAVIAVFHDTIITIGVFSIFNKEIDLTVIAALLTLVGYSMNDTIVIFDRIRENLRLNRREKLVDVINRSVNQTLSRTAMTSGLTFLTVLALFLFGGPVLHNFSFALVVGILIGTYSSVFVASPIVLYGHDKLEARRKAAPVLAASPVNSGLKSGAAGVKPGVGKVVRKGQAGA